MGQVPITKDTGDELRQFFVFSLSIYVLYHKILLRSQIIQTQYNKEHSLYQIQQQPVPLTWQAPATARGYYIIRYQLLHTQKAKTEIKFGFHYLLLSSNNPLTPPICGLYCVDRMFLPCRPCCVRWGPVTNSEACNHFWKLSSSP